MSHYLKSLLISIFLYMSLFALAIYALEESEQFCKENSKSQKNSRVSISMIEQATTPPQKKPQPVHKPKPIKKPKKKIVEKKPQAKKKPLPVEKVVKKEPVPVEKVKPEEVAQEVEEEVVKELVEEVVESEQETAPAEELVKQEVMSQTQTQKQESAQELKARQDLFLASLVERINSNKSYPYVARRRCIEGDIKMAFHVFANGSVKNIEMVSGKKIFKKSAYEAIVRSFPVDVDTTLFDFPKEFTITIAYILK